MRNCPRCNVDKDESEFYSKRGKPGSSSYCKPCTTEQTLERQRAFKRRCIEYKGGQCVHCGYDRCDSALEFHHLDPSEKDFSIAHARFTSWGKRVTDELDKCALLCCNCHREAHAGLIQITQT